MFSLIDNDLGHLRNTTGRDCMRLIVGLDDRSPRAHLMTQLIEYMY